MNKDTCETCIYWDAFETESRLHYNVSDIGYGWCSNELIGESSRFDNQGNTSCLDYPYDEGGRFIMGKDFGCVHHEAYQGKQKPNK